jgi:hypothetical protein
LESRAVNQLASVEVASQATSAKRRKRKRRMDEFEIDWIPEDTGADELFLDIPAHTIDKLCKAKFGHTNWARMGQMSPEELVGNPHEFDYENGVIFFKNAHMV